MNSSDFQVGARRTFGNHYAWIEAPDVFGIRFSGPTSGDELRGMLDFQIEWGRDKQQYFVFCDLSQIGTVSPSARRVMNEGTTSLNARVINVCYGASFTIRVLADMVGRARRMLRPNDSLGEGIFVATEEEARNIIKHRRSLGT